MLWSNCIYIFILNKLVTYFCPSLILLMDTNYKRRLPSLLGLSSWVDSLAHLASLCIFYNCSWWFFPCTFNLSIRIVFESRLSFNNWFYAGNWIYRKIQVHVFTWILMLWSSLHNTKVRWTIVFFAGPCAWNSLPADLQEQSNTKTFKKQFKTFLFTSAYLY